MNADKSQRSVVLVEDNPGDAALMHRAFARAKLQCGLTIFEDGGDAVDALTGTGELPAFILLDLKLPRLSGLEVLRRLRTHPRTRRTPVIILTSSIQPEDIRASYELGANSYVRKPVDFDHFVQLVRSLTDYWTRINEADRPV